MEDQAQDFFENEKSTKKLDGEIIKCESCGGNMIFDPLTQILTCEHCGNKIDFEKNREVREIAIEQAFSQAESWEETSVLRCDNCGAVITVDRDEVALNCPYCGTSHIKKTDEIVGVKPNALYPFLLTKSQATQKARKWAKSRIFSPKKFKKNLEEKNLHGIYLPCFTFDSQSQSSYSGRLGERKTRTVRTKNGTRTETYIVWYNVSGVIDMNFDDITISASSKIKAKNFSKIMPYKSDTICVYEKKYLAGFIASHYDKDIKTSWSEAKSVMEERIRSAILQRYHCDIVDYLNTSTTHNNVTYKYVLLPIYALFYHYGKKDYTVNVNGNTGKTSGNAPVSFLRVLIAILLGVGVITGLWFLFKHFSADTNELAMAIMNKLKLIKR